MYEKESGKDGLEIHRSPLFSSKEDSRINYVTATLEFIMKFLKPQHNIATMGKGHVHVGR